MRQIEDPYGSKTSSITPYPSWLARAFVCALGALALLVSSRAANAEPLDTIWFDDGLPEGAVASTIGSNSAWTWLRGSTNYTTTTHYIAGNGAANASIPLPASGSFLHTIGNAAGTHGHSFSGATHPLTINAGDSMVTYVYLDPANPTTQLKIGWLDTTGAWHDAYWSASSADSMGDGGRWVDALPPVGQWARLEISASAVGLESKAIRGMRFRLYGGAASFDRAGKINTGSGWVDDALPAGATPIGSWFWTSNAPRPYAGLYHHRVSLAHGTHEHGFTGATTGMVVPKGATLVTYVRVESPTDEIMISWHDGTSWEHRAYWRDAQDDKIHRGVEHTASRWYAGPLPPMNQWVRLEVPASLVGLEGATVKGMMFTLFEGAATFDRSGVGPHPTGDEFLGPLAGWIDVKAVYGAEGDGVADDTAAIQDALDDLSDGETLYLPAGEYKITSTLHVANRYGIAIVGEDPRTTIIRWDGSANHYIDGPVSCTPAAPCTAAAPGSEPIAMLDLRGVHYSEVKRLTWDGLASDGSHADAGVFVHASATDSFPTSNRHSDEIFKDTQFGLWLGAAGKGVSEQQILRTQFLRNDLAGIFFMNDNSVDNWVWDSYFDQCYEAISAQVRPDPARLGVDVALQGRGTISVYRSVFRGSKDADISIANTNHFLSARSNTSIGSRFFFISEGPRTPQSVNLIGNVLLDTCYRDTAGGQALAAYEWNIGPLTALDNFMRCPLGGSVAIYANDALTSIGNTFSGQSPSSVPPAQPPLPPHRIVSLDDQSSFTGSATPWPVTTFPGHLPRYDRAPPIVVTPAAGGADNSAAINNAIVQAAAAGLNSVVHLHGAVFNVAQTINVPATRDVQLVGDGLVATDLRWTGAGAGPVVRVQGTGSPAIRNLNIDSQSATASGPTGLQIQVRDVPDSKLFGDGLLIDHNYDRNLTQSGNDLAVELRASQNGFAESGPGFEVIGTSELHHFGGSSVSSDSIFALSGGQALIADIWAEQHPVYRYMDLVSGNLSMTGGLLSAGPEGTDIGDPQIDLNNFSGKLTLLGTAEKDFTTGVLIRGNGIRARAFFSVIAEADDCHLIPNQSFVTNTTSPPAGVWVAQSVSQSAMVCPIGGSEPPSNWSTSPDLGGATDSTYRMMLQQIRATLPQPLRAPVPFVSRVLVDRVLVWYGRTGVAVEPI